MKRRETPLVLLILLVVTPGIARAQAWSGILPAGSGIDWSTAGVIGGMQAAQAARTAVCTTLGTAGQVPSFAQSVTIAQINTAISNCSAAHPSDAGGVVLLNPGTYSMPSGSIQLANNVTLKGFGPQQTIINETGGGSGLTCINSDSPMVALGIGPCPNISNGVAITVDGVHNLQGSTTIIVASAGNISVGKLLVLTQLNYPYMTAGGDQGCSWCDGFGGYAGVSGQTVRVTSVNGTTIGISDPLYLNYSNTPQAVPFNVGCLACGLESMKLSYNNHGHDPNFTMVAAWNSWMYNVESDFANAHTHIEWSGHNTFFGNFFHDGYQHGPGNEDNQFRLGYKASANLIENNIFWRQHVSIMPEWGCSGNVIAYNYSTGNYDDSGNWFITDINTHGALPLMNLYEGNIFDEWRADSIHGNTAYQTFFRNYATGMQMKVPPFDARGALQPGSAAYESNNADCAFCLDWGPNSATPEGGTVYENDVGNILGSTHLISARGAVSNNVAPAGMAPACSQRGYDSSPGTPSPNLQEATLFLHGQFQCTTKTFVWSGSVTHTFPPSFYRNSAPSYWGSVPWPPIGPDVTSGNWSDSATGGFVNAIPAVNCFNTATSNGTTNVTTFDAAVCYATGPTFSASLSSIPADHAANLTLILTGSGTSWTGSTVFTISGVAGVTLVSYSNSSPTSETIVITTGSSKGTLTITDTTHSLSAKVPVVVAPPTNLNATVQ